MFEENLVRKTWSGKSQECSYLVVFEKHRFKICFVHTPNRKAGVSDFSGLKSVFEKFHFRNGSEQMVALTVEIKLCSGGACNARNLSVTKFDSLELS